MRNPGRYLPIVLLLHLDVQSSAVVFCLKPSPPERI